MKREESAAIWRAAGICREWQRFLGMFSAFFFALALLSLFDGLQAKTRAGPQELDLLPGETLQISGPCAVKNPVTSDVKVRWSPGGAPINFELEGFYAGYWFGSGMWRGEIKAADGAKSGRYSFTLSFRGASAQSAQTYYINLYETAAAERASSLSAICRLLGLNPFALAAGSAALALAAGAAVYALGMRRMRGLKKLGLYEIYRVDQAERRAWCLAAKSQSPPAGAMLDVLSPKGEILGKARAEGWSKGRISLAFSEGIELTTNDLARLKPETPFPVFNND